jgi:hypothetical protein
MGASARFFLQRLLVCGVLISASIGDVSADIDDVSAGLGGAARTYQHSSVFCVSQEV